MYLPTACDSAAQWYRQALAALAPAVCNPPLSQGMDIGRLAHTLTRHALRLVSPVVALFYKFQPLRSESTSCLAGYVCWCWVPPLLWLVGRRKQQTAGVATGPRRLPARQQVTRGSNLAQLCCLIMRAPHRPITVTVASRRKTTAESAVLRCQQQSMQVSDVTPYCATHHTSSYKCAKYQAPTESFVSMSQLHQRRGRRCCRECVPPCARAGLGVRCCDHHLPAAEQ